MTGRKKQQLLEENTQQESLEDVFPSALFVGCIYSHVQMKSRGSTHV